MTLNCWKDTYVVKVARTMWSGGKVEDNIKRLPITMLDFKKKLIEQKEGKNEMIYNYIDILMKICQIGQSLLCKS